MKFLCYYRFMIICVFLFTFVANYKVPEPNILVFDKGFRVSVPDEDGIQLFAFHGNINKDMNGLEAGQFSIDITKKRGNEWVFEELDSKLKPGDVIYYWVYVQKRGLGYRYDNGEFVVKGKTMYPYNVPEPKIEVLDKGFKVSIPHEEGIELFSYHGNINKPMNGLEAGHHSKDILEKKDNKWIFEEKNAELKDGDVIHYWLFVVKDKLGYRYDNGTFAVRAHPSKVADIDVRLSPTDLNSSNTTFESSDVVEEKIPTTTESLEKLKKINKIWIR